MQDTAPAKPAGPSAAGPTRPSAKKHRRRLRVLLVAVVLIAAVLGVYFAFFYTPGLPIPAGTVLRIGSGDLLNPIIGHYLVWAFTVTRCCAVLKGSYHANYQVGWGIGGPDYWSLHQYGGLECINEPLGSPMDGNFSMMSPFGNGPGVFFFSVPCGLPSPETITITQTIQLVYV